MLTLEGMHADKAGLCGATHVLYGRGSQNCRPGVKAPYDVAYLRIMSTCHANELRDPGCTACLC